MSPQQRRGERIGVDLIYDPVYLEHDTGGHPESAPRLRGILGALARHGTSEEELIRPGPVSVSLLAEVHDPRYIADIEKLANKGGGLWDWDTQVSPASYRAATVAAGGAVEAVDRVMEGARAAFSIARPPGHHALYSSAMGFCLFNNAAVAAHHATRKHGLRRVMIVDWDVHHGNGTQDFFYARPDVLFISTHQYPFYPGTGAAEETGEGDGRGYTVNVPLPAGVGDEGYRRVFETIVEPVATRYRPQLILISAGYDAHVADPLGGMAVTVAGFHALAQIVRRLADTVEECEGRVAAILEGGYNIEALSQSVLATIAALGADGRSILSRGEPDATLSTAYGGRRAPDVEAIIAKVRAIHGL